MQAVTPETDDQHDREAQDREKTGNREVARHGEGMQAEQAERHEADHVQHQDEHEEREDIGRIFAAFGADIGVHHAGNEAGEALDGDLRSEEHTSELQSLMRISYAVFCLKKKNYATHNIKKT